MRARFSEALVLVAFVALAGAASDFIAVSRLRLSAAVLGLVVLLLLLAVRGRVDPPVERVAERLLRWFPLLFVPATTGIIAYLPLLRASWLGIGLALCISTLLGITVATLTARAVARGTART